MVEARLLDHRVAGVLGDDPIAATVAHAIAANHSAGADQMKPRPRAAGSDHCLR